MAKPINIKIKSYHVGFGDAYLLTFEYKRARDRNVLIDFGTTRMPKWRYHASLLDIANHIKTHTQGKLDVVVATHRHKDHIGGFGGKPGAVIKSLNPSRVLQPWTEHPHAAPTARRAPNTLVGFTQRLDDMHKLAEVAQRAAANANSEMALSVRNQLAFLGEDNLTNKKAVKNLMSMGTCKYVHFGQNPGLGRYLPGVKVTVLGPPSLNQYDQIRRQRHEDENEFWHLQSSAGHTSFRVGNSPFAKKFRGSKGGNYPLESRWFIPRVDRTRGDELLSIVRSLDSAMNNTSLILLFEVGKRKLLFSGDAQIENWEYVLFHAKKRRSILNKLKRIDYYKVGHHGSLNATPKSLWDILEKRNKPKKERLVTGLSTLGGVHGSRGRRTEVPRRKLIDALKDETTLVSTQNQRSKRTPWEEIEFDC